MRDGLIWLERARHKLLVQFSAGKGNKKRGPKSLVTLTLTLSRLRGKIGKIHLSSCHHSLALRRDGSVACWGD